MKHRPLHRWGEGTLRKPPKGSARAWSEAVLGASADLRRIRLETRLSNAIDPARNPIARVRFVLHRSLEASARVLITLIADLVVNPSLNR